MSGDDFNSDPAQLDRREGLDLPWGIADGLLVTPAELPKGITSPASYFTVLMTDTGMLGTQRKFHDIIDPGDIKLIGSGLSSPRPVSEPSFGP